MCRENERNYCRAAERRRRFHYRGFLEMITGADSLDLFELVMLWRMSTPEILAEDPEPATVGDVMNYLKEKGVEA